MATTPRTLQQLVEHASDPDLIKAAQRAHVELSDRVEEQVARCTALEATAPTNRDLGTLTALYKGVATELAAGDEIAAAARRQILREGFRLLAPGGTLALCDIHPEYNPSPIMLSGEPYLNGYLDKIDFEAATSAAKHGLRLHREVLVEGRLVLWTFQKAP